jgi:hypothetical protein
LQAVRDIISKFKNRNIYADKAYIDSNVTTLANANGTVIHTPIKKKCGQEQLDSAESLYSTSIGRIRQPIESLFNQIDEEVKL